MTTRDWQLTARCLSESLRLSYGTKHHIITQFFGYGKVCARFVQRMLTHENKQVHLQTSSKNLRAVAGRYRQIYLNIRYCG